MLVGSFFFSCMGVFTHLLRDELSWATIALVRTSMALVIAGTLAVRGGAPLLIFRPATLWIRSIAGSCSLVLMFYALTHTKSLGEVLVLSNMFPVWIALLSWPVLGTWPTWDAWLAIATGMLGVIVIQQPGDGGGMDSALIAAALGSLTTAIAMMGLHRLHHLDPRSIVAHFSGVSVLFCLAALVLSPARSGGAALADPRLLLLLALVGVTATIGQLFLTKAFAAGKPAKVSVVALSQVFFSAVADTLIWQRPLKVSTLAGMALIVAPTAWLLLRSARQAPEILPDEPDVVPPQVE